MAFDATKNFAKVTVSIGYAAGATSIVLTAGHGARLPEPSVDEEFNLVWWNNSDYGDPSDDPNKEIVRCTARSTDTLTVTRAQESTGDSIKNIAAKTYRMALAITAKVVDDITVAIPVVATGAEVNTGTDDAKFTSAKAMKDSDYLSSMTDVVAASATVEGKVELAISSEVDTGTDSTRAIPVDQFVASKRNIRWLVFPLVEVETDCAIATNIFGDFVSPIAGTILQSDSTPFYIFATNSTAGTTGTMVVDVSINGTSIMTTNKLDFDTTEKTTATAATPPDLTTTSLSVGDIITIDIDSIHTTAAKGLTLYMAVRE